MTDAQHDQQITETLNRTAAVLLGQDATRSGGEATATFRAGRRRRARKRAGAALSSALAVATLSLALVAVQGHRSSESMAASGPTVRPAVGGSFVPPWAERPVPPHPQPGRTTVPRPTDGRLLQVTPEIDGLRLGVYTAADGSRCFGSAMDGGGFMGCMDDLKPGWQGIDLSSIEFPPSVSYGYVPAAAVGLYRQTGESDPQPVPLYRGPAGFEHLNFFAAAGGRASGPERFYTVDDHGRLLDERTAGNAAPASPPSPR